MKPKPKQKQEKPQKNNVAKSLSNYTKEIEKLDKQYSELSDEIKSLKRSRYLDIIFKIGVQVLGNDMIHDSLKEEIEEFIKWVESILSKFQ